MPVRRRDADARGLVRPSEGSTCSSTVSFSIDEARLALVARGIQEHGWPLLPFRQGVYAGFPAALSMVPEPGIFGQSDFAARLPSVIFGALAVPVVALHAGRLGGLIAAIIVAVLSRSIPADLLVASGLVLFAVRVAMDVTLLGFDVALARRSSVVCCIAASRPPSGCSLTSCS